LLSICDTFESQEGPMLKSFVVGLKAPIAARIERRTRTIRAGTAQRLRAAVDTIEEDVTTTPLARTS
jgi:hypothetical protein